MFIYAYMYRKFNKYINTHTYKRRHHVHEQHVKLQSGFSLIIGKHTIDIN